MGAEEQLDIEFPSEGELVTVAAAKAKLLKNGVNSAHEAFADYMLINPGCTYAEMQQVFGYSVSWICTVVNSDMFKAYFGQRRQGIAVSIAQDLPAKLQAAAHLATEKLIGVIARTDDPEILIDAFDKVLHRYGFAPNAKGGAQQAAVINNTQNVFYLEKGDLAKAREKMIQAHAPQELEVKGEQIAIGAPVPAS